MSSLADLVQFGQWLTDRQDKVVTNMWREQRQAQENLVKGLYDALREQPGQGSMYSPANPIQYLLSNLKGEDDVEAFLHTFETTAIATGWPRPQWVTILGPYLTSPAQVV